MNGIEKISARILADAESEAAARLLIPNTVEIVEPKKGTKRS